MSLSDWTAVYGIKGTETFEWATRGEKSYRSPVNKSAVCHNKTLKDNPKDGHIDFDFRLIHLKAIAGAVFKASNNRFIYIYVKIKQ